MGTENKGKWVDVKERMPQKTGWYDVKTKYQIGPLNLRYPPLWMENSCGLYPTKVL